MLLTNVHSFFTDFVVSGNTNRASVEPRTDPVVWLQISNTPVYVRMPHIRLKELYNFVVIEAIQNVVHVVPCFGKTNEYFVNKYIFWALIFQKFLIKLEV